MSAQQAARPTAPFPQPPPFYKHFTKHNTAELKRKQKATDRSHHDPQQDPTDHASPRDPDILSLPPELRYLLPPLPPPHTTPPTAFSQLLDLTAAPPTLTDLSISQLYPPHPAVTLNPQAHLIAMTRSLLTTFLHLVGAQSQDATRWEQETQALERLVANMHDLINRYRPHQARETLILGMEERVEGMRAEVRGIEEGRAKMGELLGSLAAAGGEGGVGGRREVIGGDDGKEEAGGRRGSGKRMSRQRAAWAALEGMKEGV